MTVTNKGKYKAPISSHPVFPAIVALWFAALLGLGSMVLPMVLLEKLVTATGLAAALPAAQPPLGVTALILIGLSAAGIGAIAGLYIARKVAAAQASPAPRRRSAAGERAEPAAAKRPISARDELGLEGLDAPVEQSPQPIAGRRRPLSVTDENRRSDFLESAPVPGFEYEAPPAPPSQTAADDDPLDLADFAEPEDEASEIAAFGSASLSGTPLTPGILPMTLNAIAERGPPSDPAPAEAPRFAAPAPEDFRMSYSAPASDPFAGLEVEPPASRFAAGPIEPARADDAGEPAPGTDRAARTLRELGTAELVERFALALQRRAEAGAEIEDRALELPAFKTAAAVAVAPAACEAAAPEPAAVAEPAIALGARPALAEAPVPHSFTAPPVPQIPAALRPIAFDEDEGEPAGDEPIAGLSLSFDPRTRPFARPADAPAAVHGDGDEEEEREGYSSLLAMKSPFGANREFVRVEDEDERDGDDDGAVEPVVVFPGQQQPRRAAPASDGPTRDPLTQASAPKPGFRPFEGPAGAASAAASFAQPAPPTTPPAKRADSSETERALRDALEKLQRMSGAA